MKNTHDFWNCLSCNEECYTLVVCDKCFSVLNSRKFRMPRIDNSLSKDICDGLAKLNDAEYEQVIKATKNRFKVFLKMRILQDFEGTIIIREYLGEISLRGERREPTSTPLDFGMRPAAMSHPSRSLPAYVTPTYDTVSGMPKRKAYQPSPKQLQHQRPGPKKKEEIQGKEGEEDNAQDNL